MACHWFESLARFERATWGSRTSVRIRLSECPTGVHPSPRPAQTRDSSRRLVEHFHVFSTRNATCSDATSCRCCSRSFSPARSERSRLPGIASRCCAAAGDLQRSRPFHLCRRSPRSHRCRVCPPSTRYRLRPAGRTWTADSRFGAWRGGARRRRRGCPPIASTRSSPRGFPSWCHRKAITDQLTSFPRDLGREGQARIDRM